MEGERRQSEHRIDRRQFLKGGLATAIGVGLFTWGAKELFPALHAHSRISKQAEREVIEQGKVSPPAKEDLQWAKDFKKAIREYPQLARSQYQVVQVENLLAQESRFNKEVAGLTDQRMAEAGYSSSGIPLGATTVGEVILIYGVPKVYKALRPVPIEEIPAPNQQPQPQRDGTQVDEVHHSLYSYNPDRSRFDHLVIEENPQSVTPQDKPQPKRVDHPSEDRAKLMRLD